MIWLVLLALASDAVALDEQVGARLPRGVALTTAAGAPTTLGALLDGRRPLVLALAYARCTMLCSVVLHGLADAVRTGPAAPGRDYLPVVISLDPRESVTAAAARQDRLLAEIGRPGERAAWPYLVGDDASVHAVADALGFRYAWDPATQQYAHPAVVFVLTPDGRVAEYLRGVRYDGLAAAVARARRGELTSSTARDLLACFHFDPTWRRYQRRVVRLFALGAAVVLAALTALIGWLVALGRRR